MSFEDFQKQWHKDWEEGMKAEFPCKYVEFLPLPAKEQINGYQGFNSVCGLTGEIVEVENCIECMKNGGGSK